MTSLLRDARFAIRLLRRNPGFTVVSTLTLALGIGATTAIFSVVYGLFFAPLPYRQPDRLVMVWEQQNGQRRGPTPASYLAFKQQATAFADINAWGGGPVNLATADRPENVPAGRATPGFLGMLGYGHPLALGRSFVEDEGIVGRDKVVILTYRLWQDRFGGDPQIVGKAVRIDDEPHTVVGVLGEGPADHQQSKIWLPLVFTEEQLRSDSGSLNVMARLKDDVELPEANASLRALGRGARADAIRAAPGTLRQRRAVPQQLRPRLDQARRVAAARRGRLPAADRLRQRRQPAADARHLAAARGRHPRRDRRDPGRGRPPADRRERGRGAGRRRARRGPGARHHRRGRRADARLHAPVRDRDRAQRARAAVRVRHLRDRRAAGGPRPGVAREPRRRRRSHEGRRPIGQHRPRSPAPRADRRRVRAGADAARRRRHGRARAGAHDERRPRLPRRAPDHVRAAGRRAPGSRRPARSRPSTGRSSSGRRRCPASPRCPCPPASRWKAPASAPGSRWSGVRCGRAAASTW